MLEAAGLNRTPSTLYLYCKNIFAHQCSLDFLFILWIISSRFVGGYDLKDRGINAIPSGTFHRLQTCKSGLWDRIWSDGLFWRFNYKRIQCLKLSSISQSFPFSESLGIKLHPVANQSMMCICVQNVPIHARGHLTMGIINLDILVFNSWNIMKSPNFNVWQSHKLILN